MATAQDVQIDRETDEVNVELTIHDEELAEYLSGFDPNERTAVAAKAFRVGATTLRLSETSKDVEHVKREFESMQDEFEAEIDDVRQELEDKFGDDGELARALENHLGEDGTLRERIEEAFGEDGDLTQRLNEELGEDGSKIQQALDPGIEGTPTYRLKQTVKDEINALQEQIAREAGRQEERRKSWQKGEDFEDTLGQMLDDLVYNTTHRVEYTGDTEGEIPGRDVGDFVVELDTGPRIVIEAKSEQGYSAPDIKEEMEDAIENRAADYGIFVTECESYVPNKVGYFQEYNQNVLCVALSADEEDDLDAGFLNIAWNWARMRTIQDRVEAGDEIDTELVQAQVEEVRDAIDRFSTVKTKCSDIESTAGEIKGLLDEIREDVTSDLNQITAELSKAA